jgi:hypothetical protein
MRQLALRDPDQMAKAIGAGRLGSYAGIFSLRSPTTWTVVVDIPKSLRARRGEQEAFQEVHHHRQPSGSEPPEARMGLCF